MPPTRPTPRFATGLAVFVVAIASLACVGTDVPVPGTEDIESIESIPAPEPVTAEPSNAPAPTTPSSRPPSKRTAQKPSGTPSPARSPTPPTPPTAIADLPPAAPPGNASGTPAQDDDRIRVDRARLEAELAGVESVDDVIGLRPHVTWTGIDGFVVSDLPDASPLSRVGLKRGDVVHSVNGRSLTSIDAAWSLGETLQTADVLEGEITRNGTRQRLVVVLD